MIKKFIAMCLAAMVAAVGIPAQFGHVVYADGPPDGLATSSGETPYVQGGEAVIVDGSLTLSIPGSNLDNAAVAIRNKEAGDTLHFTNQNNINGTYNPNTGILELSGTDTVANYQAALRSVTFSTTSSETTARVIDFTIGNGLYFYEPEHFYEFVSAPGISWTAAKDAAEVRNYFGRQGYLATITSQAENDFIQDKLLGIGWIGARDINRDLDTGAFTAGGLADGDWRWVTGPEGAADGGDGFRFYRGYVGYTPLPIEGVFQNWDDPYEPNNTSGSEWVVHIFRSNGKWNDYHPENTSVQGYVVEYGDMVGDVDPIPAQGEKTITITGPAVITIAAIPGVTPPVRGAVPVTTITETAQYTGTVTWSPAHDPFGASTVYTATITVTPKSGYTLTGVAENFFTVAGSSPPATNDANAGVVTAVFPATAAAPSGGSSSGSDRSSPPPPPAAPAPETTSINVIVNGEPQSAGEETVTEEDGKTSLTFDVNEEVVSQKIDEVLRKQLEEGQAPGDKGNLVEILVSGGDADKITTALTGDLVKKMEEENFRLSIQTGSIEYIIPASEITIDSVADMLGVSRESLRDIVIDIVMEKAEPVMMTLVSDSAAGQGMEMLVTPVTFTINARTTGANGE